MAGLSGSDLRISNACSSQVRASVSAVRAAAFAAGLLKIVHGLFPQLATYRMMGEPLHLFTKPIGVKRFNRPHDARVDVAPALAKHPAIGHVVSEGMLEPVLRLRKELHRIKKLGILQIAEQARRARLP